MEAQLHQSTPARTRPRHGLLSSRLGGAPFVVPIEATDFLDLDDAPALRSLHWARRRAVHLERTVWQRHRW